MQLPDVQPYVYGAPQQTNDGSTVITVSRVRSRGGLVSASPVGVFVIHDGKPTWEPAVDRGRITFIGTLIGALTGFAAAILATAAMVKRPPWPDISIVARR